MHKLVPFLITDGIALAVIVVVMRVSSLRSLVGV